MPAQDTRIRVIMSPPVRAARTAAFVALRPLYRRAFDSARTPDDVLRAARRTIPGSVSQVPEEITALMSFAAERNPVRVCEIGTLYGGTTLLLSRLARSVRLVVGIDLRVVNQRFLTGLAPRGQEVHLLEGSSLEPATRERLEQILAGEPLDLLFIDGSHHYEDVRADFLGYRHLVRPGGLIVFHDIVDDYGSRYGRSSGLWAGGVPQLWRELREAYPEHREFVRDPEQDAYGIGAIEWDPSVPFPA